MDGDGIMLSLTRPSEARIRAFLLRQQDLPYSYPDVGSTFGAARRVRRRPQPD